MLLASNNTCRVRKETRTCQHPGCGKKFEGSPTSLYCVEHRTRKCRAERAVPKEPMRPDEINLVLKSENSAPKQVNRICSLENCNRLYSFTVYPDHDIYPMYCEMHRTEHKRNHFLKMHKKGREIQYEEPNYSKWSDHETQIEQFALKHPLPESFKRRKSSGPPLKNSE